jgi:hypothetical protein
MAAGKKTGGRRKGTPDRATARREREIAKGGDTPLEYMLRVMRNPRADASHVERRAAHPASSGCPTPSLSTIPSTPTTSGW